jgi:hypothetical protein
MFLSLYDEVTNVLCLTLLSHDRYQYDNLILSKQTWAYPRQHLQHLLWCQGRWRGVDLTKENLETNFHLCSMLLSKLRVQYDNGFDNVESVYFFYSNPVLASPKELCPLRAGQLHSQLRVQNTRSLKVPYRQYCDLLTFQVASAMLVWTEVFWDMTQCGSARINRSFARTCYFPLSHL